MIDTLKLSKRLTEAHMPPEQAEALAPRLAQSLKKSYITREFFTAQLDARLAARKTELITFWKKVGPNKVAEGSLAGWRARAPSQ